MRMSRLLGWIVALAVTGTMAAQATEIAWWRMQEATSGFAGPAGEAPEAFVNEVVSTPDRWLNDKVSNPQYANATLPVAPGGIAVPGNTAYSLYPGAQGLFDTNPGFLNDTTYTWEAFYRRANDGVSANFYGNDNANHFNTISRVGVDGNGDVVLLLSGNDVGVSGNTVEEFTFAGPDDDAWHHFAFTYDTGTLTGYVDYSLVSSHTPTAYTLGRIFSDFSFLTVGFANETSNGSLSAFWTGDLDEIRISDEVLDPSLFLGAIPEPSVGLLFLFGLLALRHRARRS